MGKNKQSPLRAMALTSSILSQLVGGPLVGLWIGNWLDNLFSTKPLFLVLTFFVGICAGIYGTMQIVKRHTEDE